MSDHRQRQRQRQRQIEEQPARYQHQHGADRDDEVLPDDRGGPARQMLRIGQLLHVFRQEGDIGGLKGDLRAGRAHGDADIGAGKSGRVIDTVADEGHGAATRQFPHMTHLVLRQHFGMNLVGSKAEQRADPQGHRPAVPGHHDDAAHAAGPQRGERRGRARPRLVRHADGAENGRSTSQIDDGLGAVGQFPKPGVVDGRPHVPNEMKIAGPEDTKRIRPDDPCAWARADIHDMRRRDATCSRLPAYGRRDMMLGMGFEPGEQRQEAAFVRVQRDDPRHGRPTVGEGAGLVEGEDIDGGQCFERAAESADRIAAGTDMTIAQGLAATSSVAAR